MSDQTVRETTRPSPTNPAGRRPAVSHRPTTNSPAVHAMLPALRPRRGRLPLAPLGPLRSLLSSSSPASDGGLPASAADAAAAAAAKLQEEAAARRESYKKVHDFDWATGADWKMAANILFTVPPKRKEFGLDFHLVQLFFVCMPSLAVYLVALYARKEIKRMEAEAEEKRKKNEELEKEKQLEADAVKEDADSKLSRALVRLDTLEGVVKEIVDDKMKGSASGSSTKEEVLKKGETLSPDKPSDSKSNASDSQPSAAKSKDTGVITDALSNTTQWNTKGNGDKASGEPKS